MTWIENNYLQIGGVVAVVILLAVGRAKILPGVRNSPVLLWLAFAVTAVCGLVLGWSLVDVMAWVTSRPSLFGEVIGSVGAVAALWLGWHGVYLTLALIRDVADRSPDDDARKAALWVPTFLPAGWSAVWGIVSNPTGIGTSVAAAIMVGLTFLYTRKIVKAVLAARAGRQAWHWFAAVVCLLGGLVLIPLLLFLDSEGVQRLESWQLTLLRIAVGAFGLASAVAAVKDLVDRIPDRQVRAFASYGVPCLVVCGAAAVAALSGSAESGLDLLTGSTR